MVGYAYSYSFSGILSFFAVQAGAKKVYAVEASNMAQHAKVFILINLNVGLESRFSYFKMFQFPLRKVSSLFTYNNAQISPHP